MIDRSSLWTVALTQVSVITGLRILLPDDEAEALNESSIITSVDTDKLVTGWDPEVLPAHGLRPLNPSKVVSALLRPSLINEEVASFVNKSESQDITILIVLADVDVGETLRATEVSSLEVVFSIVLSLDVGTRDVVREVQTQAVQIRSCSNLNPVEFDLLSQVKLLKLGERRPLELVRVNRTKCLQLFDLWYPEVRLVLSDLTPN